MIVESIRRALSPRAESNPTGSVNALLAALGDSSAGQTVTADSAMRVSAVHACVRVLSETLATMPLKVYRRLPNGGKEVASDHPLYRILHDQPNEWQTAFEFKEMMQGHLSLRGNAYALVVGSGSATELIPVHPDNVRIERIENGRLRYLVTEKGSQKPYTQDQIFHLRGLSSDGIKGRSPIEDARDPIGLAIAAEKYGSRFFRNGTRPGIVFHGDQPITKDASEQILRQWNDRHAGADNAYRSAILPFGLKPTEIGLSNEDAQFIEARKFQITDIARIFRVPPHLIGDLDRATFSNIEMQSLEFLTYTMLPWLSRWQAAIKRDLIPEDDIFAEFVVLDILRADASSRAAFYTSMFNQGVLTVNEIRALENLNNIGDDGDKRFVPLNMQLLEDAGEVAEAPPAVQSPVAPEPEDDAADQENDTAKEEARYASRQWAHEAIRAAAAEEQSRMLGADRDQWREKYLAADAKLSDERHRNATLAGSNESLTGQLHDARHQIKVKDEQVAELEAERSEAIKAKIELAAQLSTERAMIEGERRDSQERMKAATEAVVDLLRRTVGGMIRWEVGAVRRAATKGNFIAATESFYDEHRDRMAKAVESPLAAYCVLSDQSRSASVAIDEYLAESKAATLTAAECAKDELKARVEQVTSEWQGRADDLVGKLIGGSTDV